MFVHASQPPRSGQTPSLRRRLAAFLYEGVILFGVVMFSGLIYAGLTKQQHALQGRLGLQLFLFVILALYFIWPWTHGGQTLAMKTWHIRLLTREGDPVRPPQALLRHLLSWLWFAPALLALWLGGGHGNTMIYGGLTLWVLAYALLSHVLPDHQFLHDVLSRTRIVTHRPGR